MRLYNSSRLIIFFVAATLVFCVPQFSFAVGYDYYSDYYSSDDYEYVDQNGNPLEDGNYIEETVDTSWFDSQNLQKEYHLSTAAQLLGLASLVNEEQQYWKENPHESFSGVTIVLDRDIEIDTQWQPIGDGDNVNFAGTFDGNGHVISELDIDTNSIYVGFFGYLTGTVRNLTLEGTIKSTNGPCGAFAGYINEDARLENCVSTVKVSGKAKTGGIVGFNDGGVITDCINNETVRGTRNVGGIVGENWGDIVKNGNHGDVHSSLLGSGTFGTGGVAGRSVDKRKLDRCFNTGDITSANEATGGVAGFTTNNGTQISNSYNTGNIRIKRSAGNSGSSDTYAGGIVGIVGTGGVVIKNCYSSADISGAHAEGGIIGKYYNDPEKPVKIRIKNNYFSNTNIRGVGADFEGKSINIAGGTKVHTASSLTEGAELLGKAYENVRTNVYNTGGLPILKWQTVNSKSEYTGDTSKKEIQKLDIAKKIDAKEYMILMLFNPREYIDKAVKQKNRSTDGLRKTTEKAENSASKVPGKHAKDM